MFIGDIVFLPTKEGYVKYVIKKIIDNELLVISYRTKQFNWVDSSEVIELEKFKNIYNNEEIFE